MPALLRLALRGNPPAARGRVRVPLAVRSGAPGVSLAPFPLLSSSHLGPSWKGVFRLGIYFRLLLLIPSPGSVSENKGE